MKIIKSNTNKSKKQEKKLNSNKNLDRVFSFENFIWQEEIKNILQAAILSAKKRNDSLGHILLSGDSGFWKTTLANIIARQLWKNIKILTAYAIEKPSDIIAVLNQLEDGDILFIDEIHRLKPKIEEILYIWMEDFRIDLVIDDENISLPINKFTLIWATNKLELLSDALKNRFVYKFHLKPYNQNEIKQILKIYLKNLGINYDQESINILSKKALPVPREIKNLAIKIRDYLTATNIKSLSKDNINDIIIHLKLEDYWLSSLQKRYIEILKEKEQVWLKTLSSILNVSEKVIEKDIEPLLINLNLIEKTKKWRKIKNIENL